MVSALLFASVAQAALLVPFTKRNGIYRRDSSSAALTGDGLSYEAKFTIGGQDMVSIMDTGSSDLWVPSSDGCQVSTGTASSSSDATCEYTFDSSSSSSFSANSSVPFKIAYGDGSKAVGYYAQDTLVMGSMTVSSANFALATQATTNSVFGIGLAAGEVSYYSNFAKSRSGTIYNDGGVLYDNFPWQLYRQGHTSAAAYSLYLGSPQSYSGELLFGGVDTAKFTGNIYTMPIDLEPITYSSSGTTTYPEVTRFLVNVDKIAMTSSSGTTQTIFEGCFPALLDSGSTISTFPSSVANALNAAFGTSSSTGTVGCGVEDGTVDITMRGQKFQIPFSYFVRTLYNSDGEELVDSNGDVYCSPGVSTDSSSPFFIFGDNILTALYLVYDLSNNEIGIAQANTSPSGSSTQDIETDSIPSATKASGYSTSLSYALTAARSLKFTVRASDLTSISGDSASRSTYTGDAASYEDTSATYTSKTFTTDSNGSTVGGAGRIVLNGFAAFCAALLSV